MDGHVSRETSKTTTASDPRAQLPMKRNRMFHVKHDRFNLAFDVSPFSALPSPRGQKDMESASRQRGGCGRRR